MALRRRWVWQKRGIRCTRVARHGTCESDPRPAEEQGWFAVGIFRGKSEMNHGTLWRSAYQMGAAFLFAVQPRHCGFQTGYADTSSAWARLPCFQFESLETLVASQPSACATVAVEMGGQPLETFRHPPRAMYILGAEDDGLPPRVIRQCNFHVSLPAVRSASMNVAACGSVLLYDRMLKRLILDPFPHVLPAPDAATRFSEARWSQEDFVSFRAAKNAAKKRAFQYGDNLRMTAGLEELIVLRDLLNDDDSPFFVSGMLPARLDDKPGGGLAFLPAKVRVRCLDWRAAQSLARLAEEGRCCSARIALPKPDGLRLTVELTSRRPALELFLAPGEGSPGLDYFASRMDGAVEELAELAARLRRARPGWAAGRMREPRAGEQPPLLPWPS